MTKIMNEYYIKKGKKYIPVGCDAPTLHNGVYFVENSQNCKTKTSISYWVGTDPKQPVDVLKLIEIMKQDDKLASYLTKIQDENSEEFQKLKKDSGGYVTVPPKIYNISMGELAVAILRKFYENLS